MNIEKIKNYNQKILAVLGTVVALIAVIGLISIIIFAINEIGRTFRDNNQNNGILSDEKIEELQQENKRKQLISYETPILVDSSNLIYIIPISQKTLSNSENTDKKTLGLLDSKSFSEEDKRYSGQYYGNFNNLLVYDYKSNYIEKLFKDRINFENIRTEYFKDDILILLNAATKDTYKDGVINQLDYKTLFIYSLKNKTIKKIAIENTDVSEINFVGISKNLIIKFGLDHNKDGKFDEDTEPSLIKKYDYEKGKLTDIVSPEINAELQMNLEGTKK